MLVRDAPREYVEHSRRDREARGTWAGRTRSASPRPVSPPGIELAACSSASGTPSRVGTATWNSRLSWVKPRPTGRRAPRTVLASSPSESMSSSVGMRSTSRWPMCAARAAGSAPRRDAVRITCTPAARRRRESVQLLREIDPRTVVLMCEGSEIVEQQDGHRRLGSRLALRSGGSAAPFDPSQQHAQQALHVAPDRRP